MSFNFLTYKRLVCCLLFATAFASRGAVFTETFDGANYVNNQALNNSGLWAGADEYLVGAAGEGVGGSDAIDHVANSLGANFPVANYSAVYFTAPDVNDTFRISVDFRIDPLASEASSASTPIAVDLTQSPASGLGIRAFIQRGGSSDTYDYRLGIQYHRPIGQSGGFATVNLTTGDVESNGTGALSDWMRLELTATKKSTTYRWDYQGVLYDLGATGLTTPTVMASTALSTVTGTLSDSIWTDTDGIYGGIGLQYLPSGGALAGADRLVMDNFTLEGDLFLVPEPSTTALLFVGAALLGRGLRQRSGRTHPRSLV